MSEETEIVKIRTKKGRIITLSITTRDAEYVQGYDKFDKFVKISLDDIDSLLPYQPGGTI